MKACQVLSVLFLSLCCLLAFTACSSETESVPSQPQRLESGETVSAPSSSGDSQGSSIPEAPLHSSETPRNTPDDTPGREEIRIRAVFEGGEVVAVLDDNPTAQSLLEQLPATVRFSDFAGSEKIAYFPEDLSTEGAPAGAAHEKGDVACYGPWGNLVFYYGAGDYASGVIPMGRIESGLEVLEAMGSDFEATLELVP